MWVNKPALNPVAREALKEIQESGIEVTPEIVLWVNDAACRIASTPTRPAADLIDWPTPVGGVSLYPLSFGAAAWLQTLSRSLRSDVRVLAFACAHVKKPEVFQELKIAGVKFYYRVIRWASNLRCSRNALEVALDQALGISQRVDIPDGAPVDHEELWQWGAVVVALCKKYPGTTPGYWTWEVSQDAALNMLSGINEELPDDSRVTEYEIESNRAFRAIVDHVKAGKFNG